MQILPSNELTSFIKHYLFLESSAIGIKSLRLFSDGNPGLVFSMKNKLSISQKDNDVLASLPDSFLYGQITEYKDIYLINETALIIVVFQPAGINKLLGIPADELRDHIVETGEIFGKKGVEIEERLAGETTVHDKLILLNSFFIDLVSKRASENELFISASINFILKYKGLLSIADLVKFTGYTERHIERKFMEQIGINPKKFASIVKLHSFLRYTNNRTNDISLTEIVYKAGYADQSHLIKDFKKYTGMTPNLYLNKADKLAVNFVAFPTIAT